VSSSVRAPDRAADFAWVVPGAFLVLALVFGGGTFQQSWPDAIVQLASLPILLLVLLELPRIWSNRHVRVALLLVGAIMAVPLLQLVPLPPSVWTNLPGRDLVADGFRAVGIRLPWLPVSLSPSESWRSALSLLPPLAIFLAVLDLDFRSRRALSLVLICSAFASVLIGLAQTAGGPNGPFRVYGNDTAAGFFLNSNHYAALLYSTIPFAAAWVVGLATDRRPEMVVGISLAVIVFVSLMLGLGIAQSRAGIILAIVASFASVGLSRTGGNVAHARGRKLVLAAGTIGTLLIFQFGLVGILQRVELDPLADDRWEMTQVTLRAARDFLPFGAGFGTFDSVYDMYETIDILEPTYVNNAHNDYAEVFLDGGLIAALVLAAFLSWFVMSSVRNWREPPRASALDASLCRAGGICVALLLLHSFVDYPLRSAALSTVFAFSCALMLPPKAVQSDSSFMRRSRSG
jgi:hypothetical protein